MGPKFEEAAGSDRVVGYGNDSGQSLMGVRVLGMHRSGTSFVAGAFAGAGYFLGTGDVVMGPAVDNPMGFFERQDVVAVNEAMLQSMGASWMSPPSPDTVRAHRPRLVAQLGPVVGHVLAESSGNPVVLKDPRMALLMPVWDSVVGDGVLDVLTVRHPLDIAASLQSRNGFPVHLSLALWHLYMVSLLRALDGRSFLVANFDRLARSSAEREAWTRSIGREFRRVGLPFPEVHDFRPENKHFRTPPVELLSLATPQQLQLWKLLEGLETVQHGLEIDPELLVWPTGCATLIAEVTPLVQGPSQTGPTPGGGARVREDEAERLELETETRHLREAVEERQAVLDRLREELAEAIDRCVSLERLNADLAREAVEGRLREDDLGARLAVVEQDLAVARALIDDMQLLQSSEYMRASELERSKEALAAEVNRLHVDLLAAMTRVSASDEAVAERQAVLDRLRGELAEAVDRCVSLERIKEALAEEVNQLQVRLLESESRSSSLERRLIRLNEESRSEQLAELSIAHATAARAADAERTIRASVDSLAEALASVHVRLHELSAERADLVMVARRLGEQDRSLRTSLEQACAETVALRDSLVESERRHLSEMESIMRSRSWRLTRPLRATARILRGGRPRNI